MTSSQYGPYIQGCTRATMAGTEGREAARRSKPLRAGPSSDRGLQPDPVKSDLLVTAHQLRRISYGAVNAFPGLVHTARHIMKAVCTRSLAYVSLRCGW